MTACRILCLNLSQNVPAVKCSDEQFACKNKKECVHKNKVCNEQENCADGSDEENCKVSDKNFLARLT